MPHVAIGRTLGLAVALVLAAPPAAAQAIYKWVDEKGTTHFSESPPTDERKSEKVKPKVIPPSAPRVAADEAATWKAKDAEFRKRQIDRETREAAEEKEKARRDENCDRARRRVAYLDNTPRLYRDHADGSRTFLEAAEREAEISRARGAADAACR